MGSQKKRKKKTKRREYNNFNPPVPRGFEEDFDFDERKGLRDLPSYAGYKPDFGKEVYSWSDSRTWIDLSPAQKRQALVSFKGIYLVVVAALLIIWFLISFIYRMSTEADGGKVALSMLPSFIIVAACAAIMLISYLGGWGKLVRWGYRHNLIRGRDAADKQFHRKMEEEIDRADIAKLIECAVDVTGEYVILTLYGQKYPYLRNAVNITLSKQDDMLRLVFFIDGREIKFPKDLPKNQYVSLRKAFNEKCTVIKTEETHKFDAEKLVREIPFLLVGAGIVAASVLLILAHYLWIPEIPPFIGVFFLLMSGLVFCNIFSDIPAISDAGIPFVFSIVLLVAPPMAYVWIETEIMNNQITFLHVLTHCTPFAAGFGFFFVIGLYVLAYAISEIIDYVRFSK